MPVRFRDKEERRVQGKVEVSGVNTARLKVLSNEQTMELLRKAKAGDKAAREELISGNLRLVLSVIQKFSGRGENPDDLFQVGCVGLIKAIDGFDLSQPVRFSTYGVPMIVGEIRRYLRDNSAVRVSRSLRDTAYRVMQAREKLMADSQKEPTVEQLAAELGIPREEVVFAMDAVTEPVSLFEPLYSDSGDTVCVMDQVRDKKKSNPSFRCTGIALRFWQALSFYQIFHLHMIVKAGGNDFDKRSFFVEVVIFIVEGGIFWNGADGIPLVFPPVPYLGKGDFIHVALHSVK